MIKTKKCLGCNKDFPATTEYFHKHKSCLFGLNNLCKKCRSIKVQEWRQRPGVNERLKEVRQKPENQTKQRQHQLKKYGLTLEQKNTMYLAQNGCCAICKQSVPFDKIGVDHNHKTNKNRGLLCNKHNLGIGLLDENIETLQNAIIYLKQYEETENESK